MFGIKLPSYIYIYTHRPFLGLILLVAGWTPFCCTSIMQISTTSQRCSIHGLRSGDFGGHIVCVGVCEGGMGFRWEACNLWSRAIAFLCALFYRYHVQQGGDGIESGGHSNSFGGAWPANAPPWPCGLLLLYLLQGRGVTVADFYYRRWRGVVIERYNIYIYIYIYIYMNRKNK